METLNNLLATLQAANVHARRDAGGLKAPESLAQGFSLGAHRVPKIGGLKGRENRSELLDAWPLPFPSILGYPSRPFRPHSSSPSYPKAEALGLTLATLQAAKGALTCNQSSPNRIPRLKWAWLLRSFRPRRAHARRDVDAIGGVSNRRGLKAPESLAQGFSLGAHRTSRIGGLKGRENRSDALIGWRSGHPTRSVRPITTGRSTSTHDSFGKGLPRQSTRQILPGAIVLEI